MATLVLGAAGAALGGPLGSAVGSFLGREIDRDFAPGPQPRLSDLRLSSNQYGDIIPNVHGRLRVGGTVIWSTSPVATATVSKSGSGQGSSVSFALALSSGRIETVGRIWADGRLIRDSDGQQAIDFDLRMHAGDEDQECDPLIASALGNELAPAFRGIGYLVFEDFDLSGFGNRLPILSVEVEAGSEPITAEKVISEGLGIGRGAEVSHEVVGFASGGDDQGSAIAPLCTAISPAFGYDGSVWSLGVSGSHHEVESGWWTLEIETFARIASVAGPSSPTRISIRYFDSEFDFAASEKSARLPGEYRLERIEVPAALSGESAKAMAVEQLMRTAETENSQWLNLPLSYFRIQVGDLVSCSLQPARTYKVAEKLFSAGKVRFRIRPQTAVIQGLTTDHGEFASVSVLKQEPITISLVELPGELLQSEPQVAVMVSGGPQPFEARQVSISGDGFEKTLQSAGIPAPQGKLLSSVFEAMAGVIDHRNEIHVHFEHDPLLNSFDEEELLAGANLLCLGGEFVQFAKAEPLGNGGYCLTGLLRGRFDTEVIAHPAGETVLLLEPAALKTVALPRDCLGATISARVHGPNGSMGSAELIIRGLAARSWAPAHIEVQEEEDGLRVTWTRRCKEGSPWLDFVDAPLGVSHEAYAVSLRDSADRILRFETQKPSIFIDAQEVATFAQRPWQLEVRQLGDFTAGNPLLHAID